MICSWCHPENREPISHGICRRHELEQLVNHGHGTADEIWELARIYEDEWEPLPMPAELAGLIVQWSIIAFAVLYLGWQVVLR